MLFVSIRSYHQPWYQHLNQDLCASFSCLRAEYNEWQAYGQSKLANCLFSHELARRCKSLRIPVTSNCMHPGVVGTEVSFPSGVRIL